MDKCKFLVIVLFFAAATTVRAQKYADIYGSLPNKTLDQAYSLLMEYQRANPQWANTYVQLGMICEKKLRETDPLRDIQTAQYWADNAKLFLETFGVFYSEGDVRTNSEYYRNLGIPAAGNHIQDSELKAFVEEHLRFCRNFRDSTTLAYQALEESKGYYNKCINTFKGICNEYGNLNEMLLRHDENLKGILDTLGADMDNSVKAFARYKEILAAYPILDYRQTYELKPIETFRLDGLTNSDFYMEHFTMWDYRKWIDEVERTFNADIVPLRNRIDDINRQYEQGKQEYESHAPFVAAVAEPYDDLFIFQLGKYDNNSLVRELFAYLDDRRKLLLMAGDSLVLPIDSSAALLNRKMRHIYRISEQLQQTEQSLAVAEKSMTPEHIVRFAGFFDQNYGGRQGLEKYAETETMFLDRVFGDVLGNFSAYTKLVGRQQARPAYSIRGKAAPVPLWIVAENDMPELKGSYITTCVSYNQQGLPDYVAGIKKNANNVAFVARIDDNRATAWLVELKNAEQICNMSVNGSGCVVAVRQNDQLAVVFLDGNGKETRRIGQSGNMPAAVSHEELSNITYLAYSANGAETRLSRIDEMNVWTIVLKSFDCIERLVDVSNGVLVVGYGEGQMVCGRINSDGSVGSISRISSSGAVPDRIFRASAQDICLFFRDAQDKLQMAIISDKGDVKWTSVR